MRYSVKQIDHFRQIEAWLEISAHGYPWPRHSYDVVRMLEIGDKAGYIWYERCSDDAVVAHICVAPEHRGKACTLHVIRETYKHARDLGAIKLYTIADDDTDIVAYVKRLGWTKDNKGWHVCLKG